MTKNHSRPPLVLAATLALALAACATPPGGVGSTEQVIATGTSDEFLVCAQRPAVAEPASARIGPAGGEISRGATQLVIPAGALQEEREFVLSPDTGQRVGVWIDGREPVRFAPGRSATLTVDISHCQPEELGTTEWSIWRMSGQEGESQRLRTFRDANRARTQIDSTSGFMIAH